jgi:uncharacterized protein YndB with AHSA1/START domain
MSRTTIHIAVPPERVFAVLADPYTYEHWVVGCKQIRGVEGNWPEAGSAFHHTVGLGPISVPDSTTSVECSRPHRLVLHARARPTGVARVETELHDRNGGTEAIMIELPIEGPMALLHNPIQDWLIDRRNRESLRRLKRLAESSPPAAAPRDPTPVPAQRSSGRTGA